MATAVDYRGTAPTTRDDLRGLRSYLSQLVGEPFLFARESYGDELTLHFGREVERPRIRGRRSIEGTHILTLRASGWAWKSAVWGALLSEEEWPGTESTPVTLHDLETRPPTPPGERVVGIDVRAVRSDGWPGGIELGLRFGDQSFLTVTPRHDPDDPLCDLADWELFTPYDRRIKAGPGVQWEYSPSNSPAVSTVFDLVPR